MSKRAGPPLFELLRERAEAGADAHAPVREPEPAVPWSGAGVTRAERSAATFEDEPRASGELRVPMTRVYMFVAVALALVVGAWAIGYQRGVQAGKSELGRLVGDAPVVTPPRTADQADPGEAPGGPTAQPTRSSAQPTTQARNQPPAPTQTRSAPVQSPVTGPWVLQADGARVSDPRTAGTNYLELATLSDEQTRDALGYLAAKGVRAIGVPVDTAGRDANNPARYTLYSLGLAVPSGQYRTTTAERRDHQRLVAGIGAEWRRERQGGSDFSQTLWRKYDP